MTGWVDLAAIAALSGLATTIIVLVGSRRWGAWYVGVTLQVAWFGFVVAFHVWILLSCSAAFAPAYVLWWRVHRREVARRA